MCLLAGGVETRLPRICRAGTTVVKTMIGQSPDDKFSDSQQGSRGPEQSVMAKQATSRRFQRRPRFIQLATLRTRTLIIHVSAHLLLHILFLYTTKFLFILQARKSRTTCVVCKELIQSIIIGPATSHLPS